jgi:hypothetical protein
MSKRSRRRNKVLAALALGIGASKLGMLGGKTASGIAGDKIASARKAMTSDVAMRGKTSLPIAKTKVTKTFPKLKVDSTGNVFKDGINKGVGNTKTKFINRDSNLGSGTGIYQGGKKVSDLNQKSINILKSGKIETGGKTFANKKEFRKFKDAERLKKRTSSMKKNTNKKNPGLFGFTFDKPLFKSGSMIKARGGGMARTKPTKMY